MAARLTIAHAWDNYRAIVMPRNAGPTQIRECRRAFYAGADSILVALMHGLSPGPEVGQSDEDYVTALHNELIAFAGDVREGRA